MQVYSVHNPLYSILCTAVRLSTRIRQPSGRAYRPLDFQIDVRASRLHWFFEPMERACIAPSAQRVVFSPSISMWFLQASPTTPLSVAENFVIAPYAPTIREIGSSWDLNLSCVLLFPPTLFSSSCLVRRRWLYPLSFPETFLTRIPLKLFQWNILVRGIYEISSSRRSPRCAQGHPLHLYLDAAQWNEGEIGKRYPYLYCWLRH